MKQFKNILYVAHPSGATQSSFEHAIKLAERNDARLTVIQIIEKIPSYILRLSPHNLRQIRLDEASVALKKLYQQSRGRVKLETKLVEGKPFLEVTYDVLRDERDLVIKPVESSDGSIDRLFGSTDMHLLRKCPCPVWLIKPTEPVSRRRIMAAVDFNELDSPDQDTTEPLNRRILELAGSLAYSENAELHVVHAWHLLGEYLLQDPGSDMISEEIESYMTNTNDLHKRWFDGIMHQTEVWISSDVYRAIQPKAHLLHGNPERVIPEISRDLLVDLMVMGTVARTGIAGLLIGNTAESILSQIDCSVLAIKPEGFLSPITLNE